MKGGHSHIKGGRKNRNYESHGTNRPQQRGKIGSEIIVLGALKMLNKKQGRGKHKGSAVHQDGYPSLQQLGRGHVRLLGVAQRGKNRGGGILNILLNISRFQNGVGVDFLQTLPDVFYQLRFGDATYIGHHDVGPGPLAQHHGLKGQLRISNLPPQQGGVGADALHKALPRSAHHRLAGRLLHAALLKALGADDEDPVNAVHQQNRVAGEKGFHRFVKGLPFLDIPHGQHGVFNLLQIGNPSRLVPLSTGVVHQGLDHVVVDDLGADQPVNENKRRAHRGVSANEKFAGDQVVAAPHLRLKCPQVVLQLSAQLFFSLLRLGLVLLLLLLGKPQHGLSV
ncbi:hypothetical protein SDC9_100200 [bioreactor metagenome]|uniref:Uncharacterized protein n=1 Tax=bioreactor metagenome TaxID=1076179 RepID=A0A645AJN9_9ZZZZ